jgi:fumarate hydratase class II
MKKRIERDSLGRVEVPADRYWGAQTQRALDNFRIGSERVPLTLIRADAVVKQAAAVVNARLGLIPKDVADAIVRAAQEVVDGTHDGEFPLRIWQTGSGTQTNMNVNEVLANRASEILGGGRGSKRCVHPNDDVNRSQSTNDTFPTAMHVAAASEATASLLPALDRLRAVFEQLAKRYAGVVKTGRTHLMDATPVTLGQTIGGWASQVAAARASVTRALDDVYELAIGGTAVGTGLNTHPDFAARAAAEIARRTQLPFRTAPDRFAALAAHDALVGLSGELRRLACALTKIANDVRWLSSGPRCGIGEIRIPANEPGSSIMPGKVNPTQCEALVMVCTQVIGLDAAVAIAGSQGNFELNVQKPLIAYNILTSMGLLSDAVDSFNERCAVGIEPNEERIADLLSRSLMLVTALTPHIGYDAAAKVAHKAHIEGTTLREAAVALGVMSAERYDELVDPKKMVAPNLGKTPRKKKK